MSTAAPSRDLAPDDPLAFFRALTLALPLSLMLWVAIARVATAFGP